MVKADLPVPPEDGEGEEGGRGGQPEQQVQRHARPAPPPLPQHPEQVVQQPQRRAHRRPLQKERRLRGDVRRHGQRSSRASRPPPRSRRASS